MWCPQKDLDTVDGRQWGEEDTSLRGRLGVHEEAQYHSQAQEEQHKVRPTLPMLGRAKVALQCEEGNKVNTGLVDLNQVI